LVTGVTGFLGQNLVVRLIEEGHKIICPCRNVSKALQLLPPSPRLSIMQGDVLDAKSLDKCFEEQSIDVVLHLAAEMDFFPSEVQKVYKVNVEGTRNVLSACCEKHKVTRFIYCSTTETIGQTTDPDKPADEEATLRPTSEYGKSKVEAEKLVTEICGKTNTDYIIIRPCGIYGPKDFFVYYELITMINQGLMFFYPQGASKYRVSFLYVDDVVDAFMLALTQGAPGSVYNLAPSNAETYADWISVISAEVGRVEPFMTLPMPIVKIVTSLLMPVMNLGKNRVFMYRPETIDRMQEDRFYSCAKAEKELGWEQKVTMDEGMRRTVAWYYKHGYLRKYPVSPLVLLTLVLGVVLYYLLA